MAIRYLSGINVDSNTLFVDSTNNRVGIGTASPSVPFEISHATGNAFKVVTNDATTNNNAGIVIENVASATSTTRRSVFIMDPTSGTGTGGDYFYITSYGNGLTSITNAKSDGLLVFGTADAERMRITSAGNVGIGTTSPNGALHVASSPQTRVLIENTGNDANGAGLIMTVRSSGTIVGNGGIYVDNSNNLILYNGGVYAGNERVRINNSGYVGINTTAPSSFLTVSPGGSGNAATFTSGANLSTNYVGITLNSVTTSGVEWYGSEIRNINTGGTPGYLNPRLGFFTQNASTYLPADRTEKMSILGNGYVGVGTTTPNVTFETNGKVRSTRLNAASQYLEIDGGDPVGPFITAAGAAKVLTIQNNSTTNSEIWFNQAVASHYLWLQAGTEKMRLNSSGNLGIGTTSPSYKLDVYGDIRAGGADPLLILQPNSGTYAFFQKLSASNGDYLRLYDGTTYSTFWKNGNVGIGTTSPTGKLDVVPTSQNGINIARAGGYPSIYGSNSLVFETDDVFYFGVYTPRVFSVNSDFYITTAGRVGIGIGTPTTKLEVVGSDENILKLKNTGGQPALVRFNDTSTSADPYIGSYGNALAFGIYGVGESIRIDSSRNVGIGTTSPGYKLDVAGTSRSDLHIFRSNQSAPTADAFIFRPADNTIALGTANSERMRISSAGALKLNAYGSGSNTGTATQRLAVDASGNVIEIPIGSGPVDGNGTANYVTKWSDTDTITNSIIYDNGTNVGIGTATPSSKLDVVGAIISTGTYQARMIGAAGGAYFGSMSAVPVIFQVNQNEVARFDASGQFSIATTTVQNPAAGRGNITIGGTSSSILNFGYNDSDNGYIFHNGDFNIVNRVSTKPLIFGTEGTERMRITSAGVVGIGTTTPSGLFEVKGDGVSYFTRGTKSILLNPNVVGQDTNALIDTSTGMALAFGTAGSERMRITTDGTLQVGTTSQTYNNATYGYVASFKGAVASQAYISVALSNQASTSEGMLFGLSSSTGDIYVLDNKPLVFYTNGTEKMRIAAGGNVGIGTTSPGAKLHVSGGEIRVDAGQAITLDIVNSMYLVGASNQLRLYNGGNAVINITAGGNVGILTTSPNNKLQIGSMGSSGYSGNDFAIGNGTQVMAFYQSATVSTWYTNTSFSLMPSGAGSVGNLGVGTDSPTQRVHVSGNIRVTGAYYDSNNSAGSSGQVLSSTGSGTDWVSLSEITGVDGTGTANYVAKWSDTDTITNSQIRDDGTTVGIGQAPGAAKLSVETITTGGETSYGKSYASLDTTGVAVAGLNASSNGQSAMFTFTCYGGDNHYQRVIYSCKNDSGTWYTSKVIDEGTNGLDVTVSANGSTITFTYKSRSGTQGYSPRILIQHLGSAINTTYL